MRLIWIYSHVLLIVMGALLILSAGCSDEPECLFAPLPQCFSDGDSTEDETENTVNEEADAIDTSVLEIRDLITGIAAAIQTTVTGHLNDIEVSTTEMRDEVENRTDGFHQRVDTDTDNITASTAAIRTAVQNIDATTRDDINESLDDIEASTTDIDDRIKEDCEDTIDNNSCDAIGT